MARNTHLLIAHGARLVTSLTLLALSANHPLLACIAGVLVYLMAFGLNHDLAHGSLGLPRKLNDGLLAVMSVPLLFPSHGMRLLHARHHARPLAADDVEGAGARETFWGALRIGPVNAAACRREAFFATQGRERRWLMVETFAAMAVVTWVLATRNVAGTGWLLAAIAMQLTASVWASYLGHRLPPRARHLLQKWAWTRSAVLISLAFHDQHHQHPKLPSGALHYAA
ncbi:MAG: fatty acid desaturase [Myxococcaceae bacterium]|nr:fatty acid desaturase [Myxococcaceae bacterium]